MKNVPGLASLLLVAALSIGSGCSLRRTGDAESLSVLRCERQSGPALANVTGPPETQCLGTISLERFSQAYYSVFQRHNEPLETSRWAWNVLNTGATLRENLQPAQPEWFTSMDEEAAWDSIGTLDNPGITLVTTALRAMPTTKPLINDPAKPGQGFPFDALQNSLINANEPIWLSHHSRSGKWTFVFTSYASGWVLSRDVATIPEEHTISWPQMSPVALIQEDFPVRTNRGRFLFFSRIGMIAPLVEADPNGFKVLLATSKNQAGEAVFEVITLPRHIAAAIPVAPTLRNFSLVVANMQRLSYGWGGLFENRDCSAAIRDLFMPFGLWLPRNSRQQAALGRVVRLSGLSNEDKARMIVENGIPFATLLAKKGHIALYIGNDHGSPVVLHSVWDLTAQRGSKEIRQHFGQMVFTTLNPSPAEPECGQSTTLLANLISMNNLEVPTTPLN